MTTSIFIKTCKKDLEWLKYCLRSIEKFAHGFEEIVIVADDDCDGHMEELPLGSAKLHYVQNWVNGYVFQQWVKLNADSYTKEDQILFVDSDCTFHTPFSPDSYMREGKPVLLKTRYGNLGGAESWKAITESVVGWPVEFEYMRRLPWMYLSESLNRFREMFPLLEEKLRNLNTRAFSEFNSLGSYIDRFEHDEYYVSDTETWMPENVAVQKWSWGVLTPEIRYELEGYLM